MYFEPGKCIDCGGSTNNRYRNRLCSPCGEAHRKDSIERAKVRRKLGIKPSKRKEYPGKFKFAGLARTYVGVAVQHGLIPRLDGQVKCFDCGKTATEYDHRDYAKPLEVQPVCASCNKLRGSAVLGSFNIDDIS